MNHSGNANKMVGETPRTDAAYFKPGATMYDLAGEMKRVERELNAANERIQSLIEERDRANRLADWKWNLRDEFQLLLGTDKIEEGIEAVKELKRRIKRLEEAGDEMAQELINQFGKSRLAYQWCKEKEDYK